MTHTPGQALVVRGGWAGHAPVEATELFIPFLKEQGYEVVISDSLDAYTDATLLADTDLILQCWTMGSLSGEQVKGLRDAVESGVGLAGWHGGIVDSFRATPEYLQLVGGQFVAHPSGIHKHTIEVAPDRTEHDIVKDLPTTMVVEDEQYWVLSDPYNDVLATTTLPVRDGDPWTTPITVPAMWTRTWGLGRVFVCTPGHHLPTLEVPEIRTVIERGLLWASR
ncbi:ThuA domain-containing protein [Streptomyces sp. NPDC020917]|uniref:ThuA domain-containing protein n=1 Tax=Streptomyces sp. NPDC020917 TaxID=3365102 RepID=UPI0037AC8C94